MKIHVLNFILARDFVPTAPTIAIRVFDPGARNYARPENRPNPDKTSENRYLTDWEWDNCKEAPFKRDLYKTVLEYEFSDIDLELYEAESDTPERKQRTLELKEKCADRLFTPERAHKLLDDFRNCYTGKEEIMAHCNAGVSRSVAIVNALNKIFDLKAEWQGRAARIIPNFLKSDHVGNLTVYNNLMIAAGLPAREYHPNYKIDEEGSKMTREKDNG